MIWLNTVFFLIKNAKNCSRKLKPILHYAKYSEIGIAATKYSYIAAKVNFFILLKLLILNAVAWEKRSVIHLTITKNTYLPDFSFDLSRRVLWISWLKKSLKNLPFLQGNLG